MAIPASFLDTNVVLYLLSSDVAKAVRAEAILRSGGLISVQVLNEAVTVCRRKLGLSWIEIEELVTMLKATCSIVPLTVHVHDLARAITRAHRIAFHDALIVSAAEAAGARTLYSEDLAHGQRFATVTVANPFLH